MICEYCDQEMLDRVGCTTLVYSDFPDGVTRARIPNGDLPCRDCMAPPRVLHHPGCDAERCPACAGQAIACDCTTPDARVLH
jgi:hypothetical protein